MSHRPRHRRLLTVLLACAAALGLTAPLASASRARPRSYSYPAGATRSVILPAHAAKTKPASKPKRPKKPKKPRLHGNPARALASFEALQERFAISGSGLYVGEPFSYLWPFSQALAATISLAHVPKLGVSLTNELKQRLVGLDSYLDTDNSGQPEGAFTSSLPAFDAAVAPPAGPGGPKYYDDNDWVGIELARLYELTRKPAVLGLAEGVMAFEMAGWQTSPELACPGGIPFSNSLGEPDRNTVTTAPAAELALQLYRITGRQQYLAFAIQAYDWVRACLLETNGMYADHISRQGVVEPMLWSYNQGSMIGAGAMLYQATGDGAYLYQARQTAKAALGYFTLERLELETPFFPAVFFRNLIYLDSITHDPPGARLAEEYAGEAWQNLREPGNVFVSGSPAEPQLLTQASITEIYAMLASPPSTYF